MKDSCCSGKRWSFRAGLGTNGQIANLAAGPIPFALSGPAPTKLQNNSIGERTTRIDYDAVTGTPAWISRMGFLSRTTTEEIQRTGDLGLQRDDPRRAIKAFLIENAALFGHGAEVLTNATISREFVSAHNGMRTVEWRQQLDGIPVFEAGFKGHITQEGRLVNISSRFLPDIENRCGDGSSTAATIGERASDICNPGRAGRTGKHR
jgi:hypothetical protein